MKMNCTLKPINLYYFKCDDKIYKIEKILNGFKRVILLDDELKERSFDLDIRKDLKDFISNEYPHLLIG